MAAADNSSITGDLANACLVGCEVPIKGRSVAGSATLQKEGTPLSYSELGSFHSITVVIGVAATVSVEV